MNPCFHTPRFRPPFWIRLLRQALRLQLAAALAAALPAAAVTISQVEVVNVAPSTFSIAFNTAEPATSSLRVYADPDGTNNLAGQLAIEPLPLRAGSPALTDDDRQRHYSRALRTHIVSHNLGLVQVSGCQPNTRYYYQVLATGADGETVAWPSTGPLPSLLTGAGSTLVPDVRQLVVNVSGENVAGQIISLSHPAAAYRLAAVVGDGAGPTQALFTLSDLITLVGGTNYVPIGEQQFEVRLPADDEGSLYTLSFTTSFAVVSSTNVTYTGGIPDGVLTLGLGDVVALAGQSVDLPISIQSTAGLSSLTLTLDLPPDRFTNPAVQPVASVLQDASIAQLSASRWQITLTAQAGQTFSNLQQVASLRLAAAQHPSAFVPIPLVSVQGFNSASQPFSLQFAHSGRIVVIESEPLLEARQDAAGHRDLILYGRPGTAYRILTAETPAASQWRLWRDVTMPDTLRFLAHPEPGQSLAFFHALAIGRPQFEIRLGPGGLPELWMRGTPGSSILIEITTSLGDPDGWTTWARIPLLASPQQLLQPLPPGAFLRAREFVADPPLIEPRLSLTGDRSLVVFGQAGVTYRLLYKTNLDNPTWSEHGSLTLPGSFDFIETLPNLPSVFYRLAKP